MDSSNRNYTRNGQKFWIYAPFVYEKDAKIPDALKKVECSIEPVDEVEAIDGDMGDDKGTGKANKKSLLMEKVPVKVQCGGMEGFMRPGDRRGDENVMVYKKDKGRERNF